MIFKNCQIIFYKTSTFNKFNVPYKVYRLKFQNYWAREVYILYKYELYKCLITRKKGTK